MAGTVSSAWDKLYRALHATDPTGSPDGGHYLNVQGTVNIIGAGSGGTSQIDNSSFVPGGSSLTPIGGYYGGRQVASGNTAAPALNASSVLQVDVISTVGGGAGGGFASAAVYGSPLFPVYNVGSVNVVNAVGVTAPGGSMQIVGSINPHGVFAAGGSVNVVGSVGVSPLATFTVALDKIPTVNLGGGTVNIGNAIVGSVNVTPVAAFSLAGVPVVSTLGSLVPTTWPISFGGSGYFAIAAAPGAGKNVNLYMIHLSTQASTRTWVSFQSPSGTFLTGSLPLAPGVGFNMNGQIPHPLLIGATNAPVFIHANGTENMAGWAAGWIE